VDATRLPGAARVAALVPPGDAAALAAATRRPAADPVSRAAMGRAARQRVLARSWASLGDQLIGHYAAVLGEWPGGRGTG
jgi:phosphatidylinositol alpha 1,6-mannosyltransferase